MADFINDLNDVQRAAATHINGPMMIVAGAGSGKTRVLTYRIAYLMQQGVDPFNILSLTFTNKAAREMRHRIETLAGPQARNLVMGTFHSVFAKLLRVESAHINYPANFTIYDSDDSRSLIKTIVKEMGLNPDHYKSAMVASRISLAKNNCVGPRRYEANPDIQMDDTNSGRPHLGKIYAEYVRRCFKAGAMDFDDLLLKTWQLISTNQGVLEKYQRKFRYILVDEYQDTNHLQYLIVKKLAEANRNICVVGDDAQSIYGFRGANINNILDFEKDYPERLIFKLEQNYRSTQTIVNASSDIIKKNLKQIEKNIWTSNEPGNKIKVFRAQSDNEEGVLVGQSIFQEKMNEKLFNRDIAILYRTNSQSRSFEEALRRLNIPYRIVGGLSFYQRKEIKDMMAYWRLAMNPADDEALKRIVNYPARGIGDTTMAKVARYALDNEKNLWEVVSQAGQYAFDARVRGALANFADLVKSFQVVAESPNAYDAAMFIAKTSGILGELYSDLDTVEGKVRYENVQELLSAVKEFTEQPQEEEDVVEDRSLGVFMQEVALLTSQDSDDDEGDDKVTMMTIHQAKGLEWPVVYIVGMEENLFPSMMSMGSRDDLEEERRLFYVALTRARRRAFLSYALTRFRFGQLIHCEPSRFIDEIAPQFLDYQLREQAEQRYVVPRPLKPSAPAARTYEPSPDFVPDDLAGLEQGMEIEHNRFGRGRVLLIEGGPNDRKARISFNDAGEKQIVLKYAKIKILTQENG